MTYDDYVAQLAIPHRAKDAFWHLALSGPDALPAVRRGLTSDDHAVRLGCTRVLDHLVDEESWPELIAMLDDTDPATRFWALHSLACDKCKDNACRPAKADIFRHALNMLQTDPSRHVRAMAVELVGRFVHEDPTAEAALVAAHAHDPDPSVRKKAGWFAPGGTRWQKTRPRVTR